MFFSSRRKLYLAEKDKELGIYPQVKIWIKPDGTYYAKKELTGLKGKPGDRRNLTILEAVAKFGQPEPEQTPDMEDTSAPVE